MVYKIIEPSMELELITTIVPEENDNVPIDIELNEDTQLLYVLNYEKNIDVLVFDPAAYS